MRINLDPGSFKCAITSKPIVGDDYDDNYDCVVIIVFGFL